MHPTGIPLSMGLKAICLVLLSSLCGCDNFPKDPQHTLEEVTNHTLIVGYSENPPWVVKGENGPEGIEPMLVNGFANTINSSVEWKNDTEQNLFEELEKGNIDLVVAGTTEKNPWKKKVGFTRPFITVGDKKHVMAVISGENAFIVKLEEYLHEQEQEVNAQLKHEKNK